MQLKHLASVIELILPKLLPDSFHRVYELFKHKVFLKGHFFFLFVL